MEKNKEKNNELKIKGLTDGAGHFVVMTEVDEKGRLWYHWNDKAITIEGFKRDKMFNLLFKIFHFYRHNKILIKTFIVILFLSLIYFIFF